MPFVLLALNVSLVILIVVLANLRAAWDGSPQAEEEKGDGASITAVLTDALSSDEAVTIRASSLIAANPRQYEAALVSLTALARTSTARRRLAVLWAARAILKERPELCSLCWQDPSADVRAAVVSSFPSPQHAAGIAHDGARAVIEAALTDRDMHVRREAVKKLHLLPAARALEAIWRGMNDPDDEVRRLSCAAVANRLDSISIVRIVERFSMAAPSEGRRLLQAVAQADPAVIAPLTQLANESSQPRLQVAALRAIGAVGVPTTCAQLVPLLALTNASVRRATANAITEIARLAGGHGIHRDVVRGLIAQLHREQDGNVILALVDALETCGGDEGAAAILARLPALNAALRERALEAVASLQRQRDGMHTGRMRVAGQPV